MYNVYCSKNRYFEAKFVISVQKRGIFFACGALLPTHYVDDEVWAKFQIYQSITQCIGSISSQSKSVSREKNFACGALFTPTMLILIYNIIDL